jgi:hypothetical protein
MGMIQLPPRRAVLALVLASPVWLGGCSFGDGAGLVGMTEPCQRISLIATLHVDATDARSIWGTQDGIGPDVARRIPGGYGVDPGPPGTIIAPDGTVIARDGDLLISGCRSAQGIVHISEGDVRRVDP